MKEIKLKRINFYKKNSFQRYLEYQMKLLYPLEEPSKMMFLFIKEQIIKIGLAVITVSVILFLGIYNRQKNEIGKDCSIVRPSYDEEQKDINVKVKPADNSFEEEKMSLSITPREFTYDEFKKELGKGKEYVNQTFLNNNISSEEISKDLYFPKKVENSFLQIHWETDKENIIEESGKVHNFKLKRDEIVTITALFQYKKFEAAYSFCVSVKPHCFTEKERFYYDIKQNVRNEDRKNNEKVCLPKIVDGKKISYKEKTVNKKIFFIMPVLLIFGIIEAVKEELQSRLKRRERQLKLDYPEIMNQIALLLSAGMTIRSVFGKLADQYGERADKQKKKRNYGYEEIAVTYYEMENGMPETEALERLGERVQLISYRKLMTLLIQNAKKGSKDLVNLLEVEAYEAYEDRKEMVKMLGEEAGTKLLFPMMIMLMIVLTIILVPVFMTL